MDISLTVPACFYSWLCWVGVELTGKPCRWNPSTSCWACHQPLPSPSCQAEARQATMKEGRKEMFYLTTHSTHFIYSYMASDMVKDHSDSEKENPLPPHMLLFSINSKGSFIPTIPRSRLKWNNNIYIFRILGAIIAVVTFFSV